MNRIAAHLLAMVMLAAGQLAAATDGAAAPDEPAMETVVVIANKSQRTLTEVASSVSAIERRQLDEWLAQDLAGMLRYEPGISVTSGGQRFGATGISVRGIDGNRVALEIDGVPVADGFRIGSFSNAARNYIDPEVIRRVEILRGPGSMLYGSDALGGVVAFQTLDPADYLGDSDRYAGLKTGYAGSADASMATATVAAGGQSLEGLMIVSYRRGHQADNAARHSSAVPDPATTDATNVVAKLVGTIGTGLEWRLVADTAHQNRATDLQSLVGGPGRYATTTAMRGDDSSRRERLSFDVAADTSTVLADRLRANFFYQNSEVRQFTRQHLAASGSTPYASSRERWFDYRQTAKGMELTLEKDVSTGALDHRLVYGFEAIGTALHEERDGLLTNLDDGSSGNVILGETFPVRDFPVSRTRELGAYLQDDIRVGDSRFSVTPALRFEHYALDSEADAVFVGDNPDTPVVEIDERNLSPRIAVVYQPDARWSAYAQYAQGFRSPPQDDVNLGFTIPQFNFTAIPNPQLKPESSRGIEVGMRFQAANAQLHVAGFYNDYKNLIESRANQGVNPDTGQLVFQSVNRTRAHIYGVEVRGDWRLGHLNWGLNDWSLQAALSMLRGQDDERDQPLSSIDPDKATVSIRYAPDGPLSGVLATTVVGRQDRLDRSVSTPFESPGYAVIDLYADYHITKSARINLGVFNITDRRYWAWSDARRLQGGDPDLEFYTQPGINAAIHVSIAL